MLARWSPAHVHPYTLQWIRWASTFGPPPEGLPDPDVWQYALQTRDTEAGWFFRYVPIRPELNKLQ